jgi:hypothetical protein
MRWVTVVAVLASWAIGAGAARAAPVEIGAGEQPSAVTDRAGTLHVVWRVPSAANVPIRYCRIPRGARTCAPADIARDATWAPHLMLRPSDGALIVVYSRNDGLTMALTSGDGGTTWTPPTPVGSGLDSVYDAALTPDGSAVDTVAYGVLDVRYQRVPLAGGVESRVVSLGAPRSTRPPRVTQLPDGRPVVTEQFRAHALVARAPAPNADPDAQGSWAAAAAGRRLGGADTSDTERSAHGTWLAAMQEGRSSPVRVWRWGGRGFTPPHTIGVLRRRAPRTLGHGTPGPDSLALGLDAAGHLFVAWSLLPRECHGHHCLVLRRSDRRGFRRPVTYAAGTAPLAQPDQIRIAVNAAGRGWLVWSTHDQRIRAVPAG